MEDISVICPLCEKQLKVNPLEEVVFCSFCKKPFAVKDGIEQLSCNEAAKKPSNEAIKKFNAILAHDYKLAEKYLEDVINKEFSENCKKYLLFRYSSYSSLSSMDLDTLSNGKKAIEENLNGIRSVNTCVAEMYYKILCASVNNKLQHSFNGELAFLKILLQNVEERFSSSLQYYANYSAEDTSELFDSVRQTCMPIVRDISNGISQYECWLQEEYDDDYIKYIICKISGLRNLYVKYKRVKFTSYRTESYESGFFISKALGENYFNTVEENMIKMLEALYSPIQQEKIKREREEEARLEKEKKYKEAFDKEVAFWDSYIALLNINKIKKAYELLKTATYTKAYKSEIVKFKKGLFGFKYLGDVAMLQAEELAELSVEDLK